MHGYELIQTLTIGLAAALACGCLAHWLGLSPITGYLLGGILVGPGTPGLAVDRELAAQMAELGVVLLMFGVGLNFHWNDLLAVRRVAVPGVAVQVGVIVPVGFALALLFGMNGWAGVFLGVTISVASTVILLRVLSDNNELHAPTGHIAVGWVVCEDVYIVIAMVLLPTLARVDEVGAGRLAMAIGWSLTKLAILSGLVALSGRRLIPWILGRVARTHSRELFVLTVLVLALGIAVGSSRLFGASMALGAFLAGMVIGRSEFASRAASEALPLRDAFAVLFFVSVGMLFEPRALIDQTRLIMAILGIVMILKPLLAFVFCIYKLCPVRVAATVAGSLAQMGEFSLIVSVLGRDLGFLTGEVVSAITAAAMIAIALSPKVYRLSEKVEGWAKLSPRLWHWLTARARLRHFRLATDHSRNDATTRSLAVVVGYGPVGRTLVRLLQENEIEPSVIELNLDTVKRLHSDRIRSIYGDASHKATLEEAGIARAQAVFLTSAGMHGTAEAIRAARELNPRLRVFARAGYVRDTPLLKRAGATVVFSSEGEVALSMTEFLLRQLGASDEQVDREKHRIREEFFGDFMAMEILLPPPAPRAPVDG